MYILMYLLTCLRSFVQISFVCLPVCLPHRLSVCLVRVINERRLVDQPVRVELCFTDICLIRKPANYRQVSLKIFSVDKSCFRAPYCHCLLKADTRMIRTLICIVLMTVVPLTGFHCITLRPLPVPKRPAGKIPGKKLTLVDSVNLLMEKKLHN